jgi:ABC-type multidrug transport system permease subunit
MRPVHAYSRIPAAGPRHGPPPGREAGPAGAWLTAAWAICVNDLRVWLRHPWQVLGTLLVPVSYTLVAFLGSQATGANPVAVVNLDHGAAGAQIVQAIQAAQVFRLHQASPAAAQRMYAQLQVAAIVTIPADTTALLGHHQQVHVQVQVDNMDLDLADDIRRAVPDAIISWYQSRQRPWPVDVGLDEQHMRVQDVQLYEYSVLPVIALVITVSGILVAGMAAAGEFEQRTIKGLLLAPVPRGVIVAGKMAAGWVFTCLVAVMVLLAGAFAGWTRPSGWGWAEALGAIALGSLFAAGLGIAIGTWGRRRQPVSVGATIVAVELFALAGGLGVIFFEPQWLQDLARWDPLTYMLHSLQQAVFYGSVAGAGRDAAILAASAAAAGVAGTLAMRRGLNR